MARTTEDQVLKLAQWAENADGKIKALAGQQRDLMDKLSAYEKQQTDTQQHLEGTVKFEIGRVTGSLTELYSNVQHTYGQVQQMIQVFESRIRAVENDNDKRSKGKDKEGKSLINVKDLKPSPLDKEDGWRKWRSEIEDYCEEVHPGMKDILEKVRLSETAVDEVWFPPSEAQWWEKSETLWRFLKRYTGTEAKRVVQGIVEDNGFEASPEKRKC